MADFTINYTSITDLYNTIFCVCNTVYMWLRKVLREGCSVKENYPALKIIIKFIRSTLAENDAV